MSDNLIEQDLKNLCDKVAGELHSIIHRIPRIEAESDAHDKDARDYLMDKASRLIKLHSALVNAFFESQT